MSSSTEPEELSGPLFRGRSETHESPAPNASAAAEATQGAALSDRDSSVTESERLNSQPEQLEKSASASVPPQDSLSEGGSTPLMPPITRRSPDVNAELTEARSGAGADPSATAGVGQAGLSRLIRPSPPHRSRDRSQLSSRAAVVDLTAPSPPLPRPTVISSASASSRSSSASSSRRNTPSRGGTGGELLANAAGGEPLRGRRPLTGALPPRGGIVLPGGSSSGSRLADSGRTGRLDNAQLARAAWTEAATAPRPSRSHRGDEGRTTAAAPANRSPIVLEISSDDADDDDDCVLPLDAFTQSPVSFSSVSAGESSSAARPAPSGSGEAATSRVRAIARDRPTNPLDVLSPSPPPSHASGPAARQVAASRTAAAARSGRAVGVSVDPATGDFLPHYHAQRSRRRVVPLVALSARRAGSFSSDPVSDDDEVIDLSASTQAAPAQLQPQRSITDFRIRSTNLAMPRLSPPRSKPRPIEHPLASTFSCPICLCPPVKASITPCGHVFCGGCLFDALKAQAKQREATDAAASGVPQGWGMGMDFFGAAAMVGGVFGGGGGPGVDDEGGGGGGPAAASGVGGAGRGRGRGRGRAGGRNAAAARCDPLAGHCPVCRADIKGGFGGIAKCGVVGIRLMIGKPVDDPREEDGRMKGAEEADKESWSETETEPESHPTTVEGSSQKERERGELGKRKRVQTTKKNEARRGTGGESESEESC